MRTDGERGGADGGEEVPWANPDIIADDEVTVSGEACRGVDADIRANLRAAPTQQPHLQVEEARLRQERGDKAIDPQSARVH